MINSHQGKLIVFEGGEGSGKSTQVKILAQKLRATGHEVVETKEPGCATQKCQEIRQILLDPAGNFTAEEELRLFIEDRADHFEKIVIPALGRGQIVISDRSTPSTISYQHYARGFDLTEILVADAKARQNIEFDLIILLDIDPVAGLARRQRPDTRFEMEKLEFHQKVRRGYLAQASAEPDRWLVLDATKTKEEIAELIGQRVVLLINKQQEKEEA